MLYDDSSGCQLYVVVILKGCQTVVYFVLVDFKRLSWSDCNLETQKTFRKPKFVLSSILKCFMDSGQVLVRTVLRIGNGTNQISAIVINSTWILDRSSKNTRRPNKSQQWAVFLIQALHRNILVNFSSSLLSTVVLLNFDEWMNGMSYFCQALLTML